MRLRTQKAVQSSSVPVHHLRQGLWMLEKAEEGLVLALGGDGLFVFVRGFCLFCFNFCRLPLFPFALPCYFPKAASRLPQPRSQPRCPRGEAPAAFPISASGLCTRCHSSKHIGLHRSQPLGRQNLVSEGFFWLPAWVQRAPWTLLFKPVNLRQTVNVLMLIQVSGSAGRCQSKWEAVNEEIACHSQGDCCRLSGRFERMSGWNVKGGEAGEGGDGPLFGRQGGKPPATATLHQ